MSPLDSRFSGMPGLRRAIAVLALAGALLVSSAGIASAQNWSFADPKGDVLSGPIDGESGTLSPNRKAGDVWRTSVSHTRNAVVIRITMRAVPSRDWIGTATIRTPRTSFDITQMKLGSLRGLSFSKTNGSGREVKCRGKSSRIIGTALQLVVPRRCLGNPGSVRVGAGVIVLDGEETVHVDDALRRGVGDELRLSPRIRRG